MCHTQHTNSVLHAALAPHLVRNEEIDRRRPQQPGARSPGLAGVADDVAQHACTRND